MHSKPIMIFFIITLLFAVTVDTSALNKRPYSSFRGRLYNQFAVGPTLTLNSVHRTFNSERDTTIDVIEKKWWHFVGFGTSLGWSTAYVFSGGFVLGGNISLQFIRGHKARFNQSQVSAPDNLGETMTFMTGPLVGWYPIETAGWAILLQPSFGYSSLSNNAPAASFRITTGYEWPVGPSGTLGFSLESELLWTKSKDDGPFPPNPADPDPHFEAHYLPVSFVLSVCAKGFRGKKW